MNTTIDITPTWREWTTVYAKLAASGETKALHALRADLLRMADMADALKELLPTFSDEQKSLFCTAITRHPTT